MEITVKVPSIKAIAAKLPKFNLRRTKAPQGIAPLQRRKFGSYKDKETGLWYAWHVIGAEGFIQLMDEGVNAKQFAEQNHMVLPMPGPSIQSYQCDCDKCQGTGASYGGKCFKCNGKGWLNPHDHRAANTFEKKVAAEKRKVTAARRKAKAPKPKKATK
jgi:hypothetical protein